MARLDYYTAADLEAIVARAAGILGVELEPAGAAEIGRRARGTPRIANRLLRRVRDFAEVRGRARIDAATARAGLALFGVDDVGLDKVDRAILGRRLPALRRRAGGAHHAGHLGGGAGRDRGGRLRAVPHPAGPAHAHPPGPSGHPGGLGPSRLDPAAGRRSHAPSPPSLFE